MSQNVVYMIMDKGTRRIIDLERRSFKEEISFNSFFPAKYLAENFRNRELCDSIGYQYKIIEGEIVEFLNNQLTVACEELEEYDSFSY